ncbi:MAG TPA: tail fiber domain-containing protein, partial [Verrucomicrobiae bacterium]|nr:tail fiber domain-containing protein [Verrucomicrobiae bacterium]
SPVKLSELRNGVGGWNYLGGASSVAVSGKLLAIGASASSAVTLADISNPAAPVLRGLMVNGLNTFTNLGNVTSVALATNTALNANLLVIASPYSNAVTLVNVADPANPQKLAELRNGIGGYTNLDGVISVALAGNLLAIASVNSSAVTLVNVSNPSSPVKLAELRNGINGYPLSGVNFVTLSGNRLAATAAGTDHAVLVDVSNPSAPMLLATATSGLNGVNDISDPSAISLAGTNVVVCGGLSDGFAILSTGLQGVGMESAGWVGIGTAHPAAALDVVGNVLVENATLFDVGALGVTFGTSTVASGNYSFAMGNNSTASGDTCVAMGEGTIASALACVAMGSGSTASGNISTAMGDNTAASGPISTAMGDNTTASGSVSTAMGYGTTASGPESTAMGDSTTASGADSTAMGRSTVASGSFSTALGCYAQATNTASLVWSDNNSPGAVSATSNSVTMRASGGYRLFSNAGSTAGVALAPNATAWSTLSDQNAKKNFTAVNGEEILGQLAGVPVERWNYKWEKDSEVPHLGPMAQAFKHTFYPGRDDKSITTLEFDGVELAAIQGLNQKLEARSAKLETENAALKSQLDELKILVQQLVTSQAK